jgi:pimeloyl-ACP methyl ester carboxylesterase
VGDLQVAWDVAGPADGQPVLLINGLGAARGSWALQVAALAEQYRVYSYDNRDVGETGPGDDPHPYGVEQFARDAAGLVTALDIGPVHVVGASMGGSIALALALERPELVRSAQIVCSWARMDPWMSELWRQWRSMFGVMGSYDWTRNSWLWVFTYRWFRDDAKMAALRRDAEDYPYPQTPEMFARQCDAAIAFDALDRLGTIGIPTQVIAGAEDILTPPRFSEEIAAGIPAARLTVLPEVGHGMFWETPRAFNAALLDFIAAQGA